MLNPLELGAILAIAVLLFGPKKIPEIANSLGKSITEFKKGAQDIEAQIRQETNVSADSKNELPPSPAPIAIDAMSSVTREDLERQMRREIEEKVRREIAAEQVAKSDARPPTV